MKKTTLILMFIALLPLAYALYGGETWSYHFDKCDKLKVNITATDRIDIGEYTILNNCTKNNTDYYFCNCNDNYNFSVKFHQKAVNNYTILFNYDYSEWEQEQGSNGGNGGNGGSSSGTSSSSFTTNVFRPFTRSMLPNLYYRFIVDGVTYTFRITNVGTNYSDIEIRSELIKDRLYLNIPKSFDLDNDDELELTLTLKEIQGRTSRIRFELYQLKIKSTPSAPIIEQLTEEVNVTTSTTSEPQIVPIEEPKPEFTKLKVIIIVGSIVILLLVLSTIGYFYFKGEKEDG